MKPTSNNKPPQSSPIRKGKMSEEEVQAVAQELTKVPEIIQEVEAPKCQPQAICQEITMRYRVDIEPVQKGDYKAFASSIKARLTNQETVELTGDFMKSLFPQVRRGGDVARNLKRSYGLSYRRIEKGRNDTYVFFIEPTREELIVQLTSAETKVIELEKFIKDKQKELVEMYDRRGNNLKELGEENAKLQSDLTNSQKTNYILLLVAILSVITIILK